MISGGTLRHCKIPDKKYELLMQEIKVMNGLSRIYSSSQLLYGQNHNWLLPSNDKITLFHPSREARCVRSNGPSLRYSLWELGVSGKRSLRPEPGRRLKYGYRLPLKVLAIKKFNVPYMINDYLPL